LSHDTDSTAVVQAAEAKGVYVLGYNSDMTMLGPRAQLSGTLQLWGDYYIAESRAVLAGKWKSRDVWGGIAENMVGVAPYGAAVPAALRALVDGKKAELVAGTLRPFAGPIKDQAGKLRVPAGKALGDAALREIKWYVDGIVGKMPK
jgi:simple sugar transport system substrate-binding protein